jgi:2,3-bisphosphoglycerate-independent phosphoglycerate mutase
VTFFFNGGVEKQFDKEERHMIDSPKVATYDMQPEMSAQDVAEKVAEAASMTLSCAISRRQTWCIPFRLPSVSSLTTDGAQVGHTGLYDAAVEAITKTDVAVGTIYAACKEAGYVLVVTADHGNAEQMINLDTGAPHTAHTTNPVPLIVTGDFTLISDGEDGKDEGALCDVAPIVLDIMGMEKPDGAHS